MLAALTGARKTPPEVASVVGAGIDQRGSGYATRTGSDHAVVWPLRPPQTTLWEDLENGVAGPPRKFSAATTNVVARGTS